MQYQDIIKWTEVDWRQPGMEYGLVHQFMYGYVLMQVGCLNFYATCKFSNQALEFVDTDAD